MYNKLERTHKKSFFVWARINSPFAEKSFFGKNPKYEDKEVVVLQMLSIKDDPSCLIVEIVYSELFEIPNAT